MKLPLTSLILIASLPITAYAADEADMAHYTLTTAGDGTVNAVITSDTANDGKTANIPTVYLLSAIDTEGKGVQYYDGITNTNWLSYKGDRNFHVTMDDSLAPLTGAVNIHGMTRIVPYTMPDSNTTVWEEVAPGYSTVDGNLTVTAENIQFATANKSNIAGVFTGHSESSRVTCKDGSAGVIINGDLTVNAHDITATNGQVGIWGIDQLGEQVEVRGNVSVNVSELSGGYAVMGAWSNLNSASILIDGDIQVKATNTLSAYYAALEAHQNPNNNGGNRQQVRAGNISLSVDNTGLGDQAQGSAGIYGAILSTFNTGIGADYAAQLGNIDVSATGITNASSELYILTVSGANLNVKTGALSASLDNTKMAAVFGICYYPKRYEVAETSTLQVQGDVTISVKNSEIGGLAGVYFGNMGTLNNKGTLSIAGDIQVNLDAATVGEVGGFICEEGLSYNFNGNVALNVDNTTAADTQGFGKGTSVSIIEAFDEVNLHFSQLTGTREALLTVENTPDATMRWSMDMERDVFGALEVRTEGVLADVTNQQSRLYVTNLTGVFEAAEGLHYHASDELYSVLVLTEETDGYAAGTWVERTGTVAGATASSLGADALFLAKNETPQAVEVGTALGNGDSLNKAAVTHDEADNRLADVYLKTDTTATNAADSHGELSVAATKEGEAAATYAIDNAYVAEGVSVRLTETDLKAQGQINAYKATFQLNHSDVEAQSGSNAPAAASGGVVEQSRISGTASALRNLSIIDSTFHADGLTSLRVENSHVDGGTFLFHVDTATLGNAMAAAGGEGGVHITLEDIATGGGTFHGESVSSGYGLTGSLLTGDITLALETTDDYPAIWTGDGKKLTLGDTIQLFDIRDSDLRGASFTLDGSWDELKEAFATNASGQTVSTYWDTSELASKGILRVVPEPATATLSLLALAALCGRRRRK